MTQYYEALEFMLGNSGTKLPTQCMLGRRGEFEGLADWLSVRPLWPKCNHITLHSMHSVHLGSVNMHAYDFFVSGPKCTKFFFIQHGRGCS